VPAHIAATTTNITFARMVALPIIFIARLIACVLAVLAWCSAVARWVMLVMMQISRDDIQVLTAIGVYQVDNTKHRKRRLPVQKRQLEESMQKPDE
jgi:hypothetical protein